jgi:hypothetical protein
LPAIGAERSAVAGLDDVLALLDDADEQMELAAQLHDEALHDQRVRGRFKTRIKNVVEAQRSALDYLAVEITNRHGTPKGLIYYPLAQAPNEFGPQMDSKMPGVATADPSIASTIERFQPYQPDGEWLRELNQLAREQKHNRLSTQIVQQTYQCEVVENATGATVRWHGLRFEPVGGGPMWQIHSEHGAIELTGTAGRDPNDPQPFDVGQMTVFGVPLDPATQQPIPSLGLSVRSGPLDRWCFTAPHQPVIPMLRNIQHQLRRAIGEIAQSARL